MIIMISKFLFLFFKSFGVNDLFWGKWGVVWDLWTDILRNFRTRISKNDYFARPNIAVMHAGSFSVNRRWRAKNGTGAAAFGGVGREISKIHIPIST